MARYKYGTYTVHRIQSSFSCRKLPYFIQDREEIADLLKEVNIFGHLNRQQRLGLADFFILASFRDDDDIFLLHEYPYSFFIVFESKRNKTFLFFAAMKRNNFV